MTGHVSDLSAATLTEPRPFVCVIDDLHRDLVRRPRRPRRRLHPRRAAAATRPHARLARRRDRATTRSGGSSGSSATRASTSPTRTPSTACPDEPGGLGGPRRLVLRPGAGRPRHLRRVRAPHPELALRLAAVRRGAGLARAAARCSPSGSGSGCWPTATTCGDHLTAARNHRTLELYALLVLALAFGRDDEAAATVAALAENAATDVLPDGVHCESSSDYHMIVLRSFVGTIANARLAGIRGPAGAGATDPRDVRRRAAPAAARRHDPGALRRRPGRLPVPAAPRGPPARPPRPALGGQRRRRGHPARDPVGELPRRRLLRPAQRVGRRRPPLRRRAVERARLRTARRRRARPLRPALGRADGATVGRSCVDPGRYTYAEDGSGWRRVVQGDRGTQHGDASTASTRRRTAAGSRRARRRRHGCSGGTPSPGSTSCAGEVVSPRYDAVHTRTLALVDDDYWVVHDRLRAASVHDYTAHWHLDPEAEGRVRVRRDDRQSVVTTPHATFVVPDGVRRRRARRRLGLAVVRGQALRPGRARRRRCAVGRRSADRRHARQRRTAGLGPHRGEPARGGGHDDPAGAGPPAPHADRGGSRTPTGGVVMTDTATRDLAPRLAPDRELPGRDVLLDPLAVAGRLPGVLGADGRVQIDSCRLVRVKYRVGESLRVVYRLELDGREHLVTARLFRSGRSDHAYERAIAQDPRPGSGPLRSVGHDPDLGAVWWTFPRDRKLGDLGWLARPGLHLGRELGLPGWRRTDVVQYVPERSVTARALDERGATLAYAKAYGPGAVPPSVAAVRQRQVAEELRRTADPVCAPYPLAWSDARRLLLMEAIPGRPWTALSGEPLARAIGGLGLAVALLHGSTPADGLPAFGRLRPDRVQHSADIVALARPDVARRLDRLAARLRATIPEPEAPVVLHGDCHPGNALVDGESVALIDLDQMGHGPAAADLGSLLARLRYAVVVDDLGAPEAAELEARFLSGYAERRRLPDRRVTGLAHRRRAARGARPARRQPGQPRRPGRPGRARRRRRHGPGPRSAAMSRPRLLFYCQHSLGLGHLARSLAIAGALADTFDVTLLNGGRLPAGTVLPARRAGREPPAAGSRRRLPAGQPRPGLERRGCAPRAPAHDPRRPGAGVAPGAPGRALPVRPQEVRVRAAAAPGDGARRRPAPAGGPVQPAGHPGPRASRPGRPRRTCHPARERLLRRGARALGPGLRPAGGDLHPEHAAADPRPLHRVRRAASGPARPRGAAAAAAPGHRGWRDGGGAAVPRGGARCTRSSRNGAGWTPPSWPGRSSRKPPGSGSAARPPARRGCTPYAGSTTSAAR